MFKVIWVGHVCNWECNCSGTSCHTWKTNVWGCVPTFMVNVGINCDIFSIELCHVNSLFLHALLQKGLGRQSFIRKY